MLSNVKIIKILECCHRQTLSLVEKKYLSCKLTQLKVKEERFQPEMDERKSLSPRQYLLQNSHWVKIVLQLPFGVPTLQWVPTSMQFRVPGAPLAPYFGDRGTRSRWL